MADYLKPFRRKVGVATLLMACGLTVLWVRSLKNHEEFMFVVRPGVDVLASAAGTVRWATISPIPTGFERRFAPYSEPIDLTDNHDRYWSLRNNQWRWSWGGFDFGAGSMTNGGTAERLTIERWAVPHWSLISPLILLSTWLLFSKPNRLNHNKTPEIDHNNE